MLRPLFELELIEIRKSNPLKIGNEIEIPDVGFVLFRMFDVSMQLILGRKDVVGKSKGLQDRSQLKR